MFSRIFSFFLVYTSLLYLSQIIFIYHCHAGRMLDAVVRSWLLHCAMGISIDQWRVSIGLFHHSISSSKKIFTISLYMYSVFILIMTLYKLFSCICHHINFLMVLNFYNIQCFFVMFLLLLQTGDIETNPGPENGYELSILHLNIRSIRNKLDFILDNFSEFNILCFSETHLDNNVPTEMLFFFEFVQCTIQKR